MEIDQSRGEAYTRLPNSRQNFVAAHLITEHKITEEYKSLEKILQEEGCLPDGVNVPIRVPKASKTILYRTYRVTTKGLLKGSQQWRLV